MLDRLMGGSILSHTDRVVGVRKPSGGFMSSCWTLRRNGGQGFGSSQHPGDAEPRGSAEAARVAVEVRETFVRTASERK
jgi:hypothetical protein